jgi:hypothetical protein
LFVPESGSRGCSVAEREDALPKVELIVQRARFIVATQPQILRGKKARGDSANGLCPGSWRAPCSSRRCPVRASLAKESVQGETDDPLKKEWRYGVLRLARVFRSIRV